MMGQSSHFHAGITWIEGKNDSFREGPGVKLIRRGGVGDRVRED
jgi:hypothetical protein